MAILLTFCKGTSVDTKKLLNLFSMVFGFIPPGLYAWNIASGSIPQQNIATWGMVFLLDAIGLLLAYKVYQAKENHAMSDAPLMQLAWFIASILILLAILSRDSFLQWGWIETVSFLCCIASIILWITRDAASGLWPYMIAMYISFIPQGAEYWHKPQPETWWLWFGSAVATLCAIFASPKGKRGLKDCFVPWGALLLNGMILALVLR